MPVRVVLPLQPMSNAALIAQLMQNNDALLQQDCNCGSIYESQARSIRELSEQVAGLQLNCNSLGASIHMLHSTALLLEATLAGMAASYGLITTGLPVLEQVVAVAAAAAQQGALDAAAVFEAINQAQQAQWRALYDAEGGEAGEAGDWVPFPGGARTQGPITAKHTVIVELDSESGAVGSSSTAGGLMALAAPPSPRRPDTQSEITPCSSPPQLQSDVENMDPMGPPPRKRGFNQFFVKAKGRIQRASGAVSAQIRGCLRSCLPFCCRSNGSQVAQ